MTAHNILHVPSRYGKTYAAITQLLGHADSQLVVASGHERRKVLAQIEDRLGSAFAEFDRTRVALPEPHRLRESKYPRTIVDNADTVLSILLGLPDHATLELLTLDQADRS